MQTPYSLSIDEMRERLVPFCRRHGIQEIAVFGSAARGEAGAESDIDLLVSPAPATSVTELIEMAGEVEELLGAQVDFVLRDQLDRSPRPHSRAEILRTAITLYAA